MKTYNLDELKERNISMDNIDDMEYDVIKNINLEECRKIIKLKIPKDKNLKQYKKLSTMQYNLEYGLHELYIIGEAKVSDITIYIVCLTGKDYYGIQYKYIDYYLETYISKIKLPKSKI